MKTKFLFLVWLVLSAGVVVAADLPKVSVYYTSPGDSQLPLPIGIFKLSNPTAKAFYIHGAAITDVRPFIQVWRDEKWVNEPIEGMCGTGWTFYPLLPNASLLFQVDAPSGGVKWRVGVGLYRKQDSLEEPVLVYSPTVQITQPMRE